ncbi:WAT1-related protein At5g40240-like isoform X2 [Hibiscus syriacus]|uniref:WAT1-related protein At5g40240-like isoform X2 n=1 Tax=Hibiscus syriacus TaxID=106335 RepID=UPI001921490C|nr:WAT1-related protein At5g40240-like isoform X2 [Hibiscus syriacus]
MNEKGELREMKVKSFLVESAPFAAMVTVEFLDVGLTTISKAAMSKGMSHFVFVVYSNALASIILLPASFFFARKKRPPITLPLLCKFFFLSIAGITLMQNCVFTGVSYSSPTLGSALANLIPAFTFLLAVIFRMEKLELRSSKSRIKILGTLVSISGALIITLYKGPPILSQPVQPHSEQSPSTMLITTSNNWVIGGLFMATAGFSLSASIIGQAAILKGYPSEITMVSFYCLFGTIQCALVALVAERNPNAWKLSPDIELISVVYSALFGSVATFGVMAWCIQRKGPVFVAMFKPLSIAIAAVFGFIFLGETLHRGSIVGAGIIVTGFYGVIWAQSKEDKDEVAKTSTTPLLHGYVHQNS